MEASSLEAVSNDFDKDDESLSIKGLSIVFLGFLIAFMTIFLPLICVLLGRPLSQENKIIFNQPVKKDGS